MDSAWCSSSTYDGQALFNIFEVPSGRLGNIKLLLTYASGKGFGVVLGLIFMALINYLFLPIFGNETKCCFVPFFQVEFGMASCLVKLRKKTFLVDSVVH